VDERKRDILQSTPGQAATDLRKMLVTLSREISALDPLRRSLLAGAIRQRSGLGVNEWLEAAESLESLVKNLEQPGQISDPVRRQRILTMLSGWQEKLERLESCFQMAARMAGKYVEPGTLDGSIGWLDERRLAVRQMIDGIEQLDAK
jgi:hypothetical protein